jgi:hypothetical protein
MSWKKREAKPIRVVCGARTRTGRPCQRLSIPGHWRCANHGGLSTGSKTPEGKARSQAGVERWRERMRALKQAGLIDRLPWGRKAGSTPKFSKDPVVARAQRIVERIQTQMAIRKRGGLLAPVPEIDAAPAVQEKPWSKMTKAEKLESNADVSLDVTRQILALGVDPENPQILKIVKDTALQIIGAAVRINETQASVMAQEQKRSQILEKMAAGFEKARKEKP